MYCADARSLMMERLDGGDEGRLSEHLAACAACRAEWRSLAAAHMLLRGEGLLDPPTTLAERVATTLARETLRPPSWLRMAMRMAWVLTGVTVMVSGLVSVFTGWQGVVGGSRWVPLAAGVGQGILAVVQVIVVALDRGGVLWTLYGCLAVGIAVVWFGALILPRVALRPQALRD